MSDNRGDPKPKNQADEVIAFVEGLVEVEIPVDVAGKNSFLKTLVSKLVSLSNDFVLTKELNDDDKKALREEILKKFRLVNAKLVKKMTQSSGDTLSFYGLLYQIIQKCSDAIRVLREIPDKEILGFEEEKINSVFPKDEKVES